jgi:hypothetical protein
VIWIWSSYIDHGRLWCKYVDWSFHFGRWVPERRAGVICYVFVVLLAFGHSCLSRYESFSYLGEGFQKEGSCLIGTFQNWETKHSTWCSRYLFVRSRESNALKNTSFGYRMHKLSWVLSHICGWHETNTYITWWGVVHLHDQYVHVVQDF